MQILRRAVSDALLLGQLGEVLDLDRVIGKPPPSLRTCSLAASKPQRRTADGLRTSRISGRRRAGSMWLPWGPVLSSGGGLVDERGNGARAARSERRLWIFIATSLIRVLRPPLESALRAAGRVVNAAGRWPPSSDGCLQCGNGQPRVHRAADRISDHPARPSIEDGNHIDEAGRDRDVSDIRHPDLVRSVDDLAAEPPFRNSISRACRPTMRSSAAIFAS